MVYFWIHFKQVRRATVVHTGRVYEGRILVERKEDVRRAIRDITDRGVVSPKDVWVEEVKGRCPV